MPRHLAPFYPALACVSTARRSVEPCSPGVTSPLKRRTLNEHAESPSTHLSAPLASRRPQLAPIKLRATPKSKAQQVHDDPSSAKLTSGDLASSKTCTGAQGACKGKRRQQRRRARPPRSPRIMAGGNQQRSSAQGAQASPRAADSELGFACYAVPAGEGRQARSPAVACLPSGAAGTLHLRSMAASGQALSESERDAALLLMAAVVPAGASRSEAEPCTRQRGSYSVTATGSPMRSLMVPRSAAADGCADAPKCCSHPIHSLMEPRSPSPPHPDHKQAAGSAWSERRAHRALTADAVRAVALDDCCESSLDSISHLLRPSASHAEQPSADLPCTAAAPDRVRVGVDIAASLQSSTHEHPGTGVTGEQRLCETHLDLDQCACEAAAACALRATAQVALHQPPHKLQEDPGTCHSALPRWCMPGGSPGEAHVMDGSWLSASGQASCEAADLLHDAGLPAAPAGQSPVVVSLSSSAGQQDQLEQREHPSLLGNEAVHVSLGAGLVQTGAAVYSVAQGRTRRARTARQPKPSTAVAVAATASARKMPGRNGSLPAALLRVTERGTASAPLVDASHAGTDDGPVGPNVATAAAVGRAVPHKPGASQPQSAAGQCQAPGASCARRNLAAELQGAHAQVPDSLLEVVALPGLRVLGSKAKASGEGETEQAVKSPRTAQREEDLLSSLMPCSSARRLRSPLCTNHCWDDCREAGDQDV